jgi:hypothetical protein
MRLSLLVAGMLGIAGSLSAQPAFNAASSTWGAGSTAFFNVGGGVYATTNPSGGTAAYSSLVSVTDAYLFGFARETPTTVGSYNLSATDLTAGTSLHLVFSGLTTLNYIAYTGGLVTAYSYNSATGALTLDVSTVNPVASASDPTGANLGSAFGMMLSTGGSNNFGGTIFRTDMYWGDIMGMQTYPGTTPIAGVNASGIDGQAITFDAYLPMSFLNANGINQPSDASALVQKAGTELPLGITATYYGPGEPGFAGGGYTYGGLSVVDFTGGGVDPFILGRYTNSSWSQGNIGITAVPEPSSYVLAFGAVALVAALRRRIVTDGSRR